MYDFTDEVVIITGGGKGVGYGIARAFASAGATLALTGRTESTLQNAKAEIERDYGSRVKYYVADGTDEEVVKATVKQVADDLGGIDVLVNNAQTTASGLSFLETEKEHFDLAVHSGLYATFYYMKAAFPYLKKSKGSIINLGSGAGIVGMPGFVSYAAAKEAIRGLSRVAAAEWTQYGINTNVLLPAIETDAMRAWAEEHPEEYEEAIKATPGGHFADAQIHVGGTALHLASPAGKMASGYSIGVDGGQNLRP